MQLLYTTCSYCILHVHAVIVLGYNTYSQPYFSTYAHAREKVCGEKGRKNTSGQTCQVFVAPTQDPEPTNQIAATRKLHVN